MRSNNPTIFYSNNIYMSGSEKINQRSNKDYKSLYLKYKRKYLELKNQRGGVLDYLLGPVKPFNPSPILECPNIYVTPGTRAYDHFTQYNVFLQAETHNFRIDFDSQLFHAQGYKLTNDVLLEMFKRGFLFNLCAQKFYKDYYDRWERDMENHMYARTILWTERILEASPIIRELAPIYMRIKSIQEKHLDDDIECKNMTHLFWELLYALTLIINLYFSVRGLTINNLKNDTQLLLLLKKDILDDYDDTALCYMIQNIFEPDGNIYNAQGGVIGERKMEKTILNIVKTIISAPDAEITNYFTNLRNKATECVRTIGEGLKV
jgi:hypothetical protein